MAKRPTKTPAKKPDRRGCPKGKGTRQGGSAARGAKARGKIGNPPFVATKEQREIVIMGSACGRTHAMIAELLGISDDTLTRHFRKELDEGLEVVNARLGNKLYEGALSGDAKKLEMWFDRRGGPNWRKKTGVEHSGPNGAPIEYHDLSDEELDARIATAMASHAVGAAKR